MTTIKDKPGATERKLIAIREGAVKALAGGKAVPYMGQSLDANALVALMDTFLGPIQKVRLGRAALRADTEARRAAAPSVMQFLRLFRGCVAGTYGESSEEFTLLGFSKKTPTPLTPDEKVHKTEQLRATRAARGTLGPKARRKVKGVVPDQPPNG
jgi:hypothetical protein